MTGAAAIGIERRQKLPFQRKRAPRHTLVRFNNHILTVYTPKAIAIPALDRFCWSGNLPFVSPLVMGDEEAKKSGQKGKYQMVPMDTKGISAVLGGCDWCAWPGMEPNPLAAVQSTVLIG